jgi:hypothetical protein
MNDFVARVRVFAAANSYSLVVGGVTLVTVVAALWVGLPARKERAQLDAEEKRLEALIGSSKSWMNQFQPASDEEAAVWQGTSAEIAALGVPPAERLTLAQIVARRAEDAGYSPAHIKFVSPPAPTTLATRQVAGVSFNPAGYALQVDGSGSLTTLNRFIETLPPAVALQSISLTAAPDGSASTSITLSVFEPAGGNVK